MDKKIIIAICVIAILIIVLTGATIMNNNNKDSKKTATQTTTSKENDIENVKTTSKGENKVYNSGKHHATITIKKYGTIKLELDADTAPITVANFAKLVNDGFYNGLTFHRIIDGFMIQGGDPLGNGTGGSKETIKGEFKANEVENNISHVRGVISMARSSSFNSASSQFFIVQKDSLHLDGQYAAFGKVLEGMDIVDKICTDTPVTDRNGTVTKDNQPIIESIVMDD